MANSWTIKGKRKVGDVEQIVDIAVVKDIELHDEWMAECFVTVNIKSAEPIDWHFDDHLTYRGEVFSISYDPNVVKKARRGTYGEGFTYDNIRFYSLGYKTRNYGFKDVVLNPQSAANTQVYTSLATFSFFCSSIEDFADRLQANLNRESQSELVSGGWKVLTPIYGRTTQRGVSITKSEWLQYFELNDEEKVSGETDVNIDIDKQSCYEVMKYAYEKFGLAYYMIGTTIIIGGKPVHLNTGDANIFRYGKGLGLYEIERTSNEDQEIVTKLFAYGSEQNLPLNYYANVGKRFYATVTAIDEDGNATLDIAWKQTYFSNPPELVKVGVDDSNNLLIDEEAEDIYRRTCYARAEWTSLHSVDPARLGIYEDGNYAKVFKPDVPASQLYSVGTVIYFVSGVNKNGWPSDHTSRIGDTYPATLSVNRLMLPGFPLVSLKYWVENNEDAEIRSLSDMYVFSADKFDPWIKSKNIEKIGLFEGAANYDGSQQKEIYPTIENTEAGVVVTDTDITDNGYLEDGTDIGFTLKVARNVLDWKELLNNALEVYIEMRSGFCVGRRFKVLNVKENTESNCWEIKAERDRDSSTGRYFPYFDNAVSKYAQVKNGDTFVVTGIQMPDTYIEAASKKLLIAACGYLDRRDHMRYTYLPKIDELFMQRDHDKRGENSYYSIVRSGMSLEFEDTDLGIWHSPFIDNLTIKENGNNGIPTFEVVLRDEKEKGTLEKMAERIEELTGATEVVERQSYPNMNVEYAEWILGTPYYYQTLNTNPNPNISTRPYVETSYVWHGGCLWMCLRTLTQEEPWFTSNDWKCVRSDSIALNFFDDNEENPMPITIVQIRTGSVDFTVVPYLILGNTDITDGNVTAWKWTRESESTGSDQQWNALPKTNNRKLNVKDADMPTGWTRGHKLEFTCTATLAFDIDKNVNTIINKVIF